MFQTNLFVIFQSSECVRTVFGEHKINIFPMNNICTRHVKLLKGIMLNKIYLEKKNGEQLMEIVCTKDV